MDLRVGVVILQRRNCERGTFIQDTEFRSQRRSGDQAFEGSGGAILGQGTQMLVNVRAAGRDEDPGVRMRSGACHREVAAEFPQ